MYSRIHKQNGPQVHRCGHFFVKQSRYNAGLTWYPSVIRDFFGYIYDTIIALAKAASKTKRYTLTVAGFYIPQALPHFFGWHFKLPKSTFFTL